MKKIKLLYIGNKLSKHGVNKTTVETLGKSLEEEGYTVFSASDKKKFFFRLLDMILTTVTLTKKVDYVLIDTYSTKAFWYAFAISQLARILKLKYIPILHGGNLPKRLQKSPRICRLLFKNAFVNVAPSNYLKSVFETEGFNNVKHISNTIHVNDYSFKERKEFQPRLLWVRAFASIYNPVMAIEVFCKLQKKYPNSVLTMVGPDKDGSLAYAQKRASELGVTVNFTGQLNKEVWWQLAANHDVFMNTTHFDNTPVSVLEAMALGLPIVSTNVGGLPFLLKNNENALLVNDRAVLEMYEAIDAIISNPIKGITLTFNARKLVESMDWDVVKEKWKALLH
ncbi:glycosyltransferase family 4 protein [Flavobacterium sp. J27]|uniref:glycosyltransferase family 4 protein n=1 Tax=Flavobacterium sp. J27 TaxID=2060419 RepID=UPI00103034D3|nr:glycosyltransferase family 4 protein [Flavobacterium sp. J27]